MKKDFKNTGASLPDLGKETTDIPGPNDPPFKVGDEVRRRLSPNSAAHKIKDIDYIAGKGWVHKLLPYKVAVSASNYVLAT